MSIEASQITGLILAGGLGTRMSADGRGTDKALMRIGSSTMIETVVSRFTPQVGTLIINCNRRREHYERIAPPNTQFVHDEIEGFAGPLAGLHAAMKICETTWILMVPCDSPFLPLNLASHLLESALASNADIATVKTPVQTHPVFVLAKTSLLNSLSDYLQSGERKIDRWYKRHPLVEVEFADENAFANINTLSELHALQAHRTP
jgi:molybdenum cofactor guanylyltransferase